MKDEMNNTTDLKLEVNYLEHYYDGLEPSLLRFQLGVINISDIQLLKEFDVFNEWIQILRSKHSIDQQAASKDLNEYLEKSGVEQNILRPVFAHQELVLRDEKTIKLETETISWVKKSYPGLESEIANFTNEHFSKIPSYFRDSIYVYLVTDTDLGRSLFANYMDQTINFTIKARTDNFEREYLDVTLQIRQGASKGDLDTIVKEIKSKMDSMVKVKELGKGVVENILRRVAIKRLKDSGLDNDMIYEALLDLGFDPVIPDDLPKDVYRLKDMFS